MARSARVSQAALIELNLIMKSRGFTIEERRATWLLLSAVLGDAIESLLPSDLALAVELEAEVMDYFDALIAAQCINRRAEPLTTDRDILEAVRKRGRLA